MNRGGKSFNIRLRLRPRRPAGGVVAKGTLHRAVNFIHQIDGEDPAVPFILPDERQQRIVEVGGRLRGIFQPVRTAIVKRNIKLDTIVTRQAHHIGKISIPRRGDAGDEIASVHGVTHIRLVDPHPQNRDPHVVHVLHVGIQIAGIVVHSPAGIRRVHSQPVVVVAVFPRQVAPLDE